MFLCHDPWPYCNIRPLSHCEEQSDVAIQRGLYMSKNKASWEWKKLKDICEKGSSSIKQGDLKNLDGDYPIYGASGFIQNVNFYQQDCEYIGIIKDGSGVGRTMFLPACSSVI